MPTRRLIAAVLCALLVASSSRADWTLPPVTGQLEGDFTALKLPGSPKLHWKATVTAADAGARAVDFTVDGPGTHARAQLRVDANGDGTWRVHEAQVDVAAWFAAVAPQLSPGLAGMAAAGTISVTGTGELRAWTVDGRVDVELRDGEIHDAARTWSIAGVNARGAVAVPSLETDGLVRIAIGEVTAGNLAARDGGVELSIDANQRVHVTRAVAVALNGDVEAAPFDFPLAKPEVRTEWRVDDVEIAQLARLLPPVLSSATGRVSGRVAMAWDARQGFVPGTGRLQVDPGGLAELRLAPQPGFLTSRVPRKISIIPGLVTIDNPAYEPLRSLEMGETTLQIESLDIGLRPEGDPNGRTARVVLTAKPEKRKEVESVRFEVNVKGPLTDVLRFGIEHNVSLNARTTK
jgi:hypothetical protein